MAYKWRLPVSKRIDLFLRRFRRLPSKYWLILGSLFGIADFLTWSILSDIQPSQRWPVTLGLGVVALLITIVSIARQPDVEEIVVHSRALTRMAREAFNSTNYAESLQLLEAAVRLDNDNTAAWSLLGRVLVRLGRFDEAVVPLNRAIELTQIKGNRHLLLVNRALARIFTDNLGAALADLDLILEENPKHTEALRIRATVWLILGRYDNAFHDLNAALKIKPNYLCARAIKAVALKRIGDLEQALRELKRCEALVPEDAVDMYHISLAYANLGRVDDAIEMLEAAIQRDPRCVPRAARDRLFDEVRNDPRFLKLITVH